MELFNFRTFFILGALCLISCVSCLPGPGFQTQHVNFILAGRSLDLPNDSPKLFGRAYVRTTESPAYISLGDTEILTDKEPSWRTVFSQDVDLTEGREWTFEVYCAEEDGHKLIGHTGPLSANEFLEENDDSMFVPILGSEGSILVRSCRTSWNLCGLAHAKAA